MSSNNDHIINLTDYSEGDAFEYQGVLWEIEGFYSHVDRPATYKLAKATVLLRKPLGSKIYSVLQRHDGTINAKQIINY